MRFIYFLTIFIFGHFLFAQNTRIQLTSNWQFKQATDNEFSKATVPGTVHTNLFENGKIPHPFIGDNEKDLQWIADKHWIYKTEFDLNKTQLNQKNIELVFEGLDTYAKVYLNGKLILEANNAFRTWKIDVKKLLKSKNELTIEFTPTQEVEVIKKQEIPYELPEGNRIFTRKAQFQYGWDWGPKYNTMGIWRPVYLEFWNDLKIQDVYIKQKKLNDKVAELTAEIEISNSTQNEFQIDLSINNQLYTKLKIQKNSNKIEIPIQIQNPKLWWTHNLGEAYLYDFKIRIKDSKDKLIDEFRLKKGLRNIELVTEKDELGESFYFKLNEVPVYMKGSNYIPQNSFQNWVKKENYEKLINDAKRSNMNMLRIWGGGIYEDDYFYELCDENGILVWQDFMFACAMYPGDEAFLENVKQEAIDNIKRLRNHSSIALWCGNNESNEGWHRWGWQDGKSEEEKTEIWGNYQKLFNGILPDLVKNMTKEPYWESSPKFGRGDKRYITEGDAHDWWIWHDGHPFEDLEKKTPRFMSEFGFQSFPSAQVIRFINQDHSTSIDTEDFKNHQKHSRGFDIIRTYMERDFNVPKNDEDYAYTSQLVQAYGIVKGIEAQRRNRPYTMGSLYWQLNDCWPSVSWSGIDYFGNWKPLQYKISKAFENVLISFEETDNHLGIYVVNDLLEDIQGNLKLEIFNFDGKLLYNKELQIQIKPNSSNKLISINLNDFSDHKNEIYLVANLNDSHQKIYVPGKPKDLKLKDDPIHFELKNIDNQPILKIESQSFQKDVMLFYEESDWQFYLEEILPNTTIEINLPKQDNIDLKKIMYKKLSRPKKKV